MKFGGEHGRRGRGERECEIYNENKMTKGSELNFEITHETQNCGHTKNSPFKSWIKIKIDFHNRYKII